MAKHLQWQAGQSPASGHQRRSCAVGGGRRGGRPVPAGWQRRRTGGHRDRRSRKTSCWSTTSTKGNGWSPSSTWISIRYDRDKFVEVRRLHTLRGREIRPRRGRIRAPGHHRLAGSQKRRHGISSFCGVGYRGMTEGLLERGRHLRAELSEAPVDAGLEKWACISSPRPSPKRKPSKRRTFVLGTLNGREAFLPRGVRAGDAHTQRGAPRGRICGPTTCPARK